MSGLEPIPMRLTCPECGALHIDEDEFATKPHHTHACQECGMVWRPAVAPTVGVRFLPGFKNPTKVHFCQVCGCSTKLCEWATGNVCAHQGKYCARHPKGERP